MQSIDKTPVKIEKEIYGFVVNRIFSALTREACYLVVPVLQRQRPLIPPSRGRWVTPWGRLRPDMTGLDLEYNVYMERFRTSGDKADLPAACLTEHYAKGEYGRKSGKGFYDYTPKG